MPTSLKCPNCSAPLNFSDNPNAVSIHCDYCNSTVIVPETSRPQKSFGEFNSGGNEADALNQVVQLVQNGRKIEAIKLFRETFGVGLKEAKEVVDAIQRQETVHFGTHSFSSAQFTTAYPNQPATVTVNGGGCIGWLIFGALMTAAMVVLVGVLGGLEGLNNPQINQVVDEINRAIGNVETTTTVQVEQDYEAIAQEIAETIVQNDPNATDVEQLAAEIAESLANNEPLDDELNTIFVEIGGEQAIAGDDGETAVSDHITLQFGRGEGNGPSFFDDTRRLAVDGEGNIYTGDYSGGRIQVFDKNGDFLRQINVGEDLYMVGMTVDFNGVVYISQTNGLARFDGITGESLGILPGTEGVRFETLGTTVEGQIVGVTRDRLMRFDPQGNLMLNVADAFGSIADYKTTHNDVAIDGAGNLYVLGSETIYKFNNDGQFVDRIGSKGEGDDQFFTSPTALAVDGQGNIYANDFWGIKVFDENGRFLQQLDSPGVTFDMVVTTDNQLIVLDRNGNEVRQYDLAGILRGQ